MKLATLRHTFLFAVIVLLMVITKVPVSGAEGYYVIDAQDVTGVNLETGEEVTSFVVSSPAAGGVQGLQFTSYSTMMMLCSNSGSGDKVYRYTSSGGNTWIRDESGTIQHPPDEGNIRGGRRLAMAPGGALLGIGQNSHDLRNITAMRYVPEFPASLIADRMRLFSPALMFPYDLAASPLDGRYAVGFFNRTILIGGVGEDVIQSPTSANIQGMCFDYTGYDAGGGEIHSLLYVTDGAAVYRYDATNFQPYGSDPLDRSNPIFIPAGTGGMASFAGLAVDSETGTLYSMGKNSNYPNPFSGPDIVMAGFSTVDGTIRGLNGSTTDPVIYHRAATNLVHQFCLRPPLKTQTYTTGNHVIDDTSRSLNPAATLDLIASGEGLPPFLQLASNSILKNVQVGVGGTKQITLSIEDVGAASFALIGQLGRLQIPSSGFFSSKTGAEARDGGVVEVQQGGLLTTESGWVRTHSGGVVTGGGSVAGRGLVVEDGGIVKPGDGIGQLSVEGDLNLMLGGTIDLDIGGTGAGTGHDAMVVTNNATNGVAKVQGRVVPRLVNGFIPQASDVFTVVTASSVLTGPIENLESGRVFTANRRGSFAAAFVDGGKSLQLSDFREEEVFDDATLAILQLDTFKIEPNNFDPEILSYDITLSFNQTQVSVYVQAADANATVKVNGASVVQPGSAGPIALQVGLNVISVEVTAPDGVTIKTYSLNVTRNALARGDFDPLFLPNDLDNPDANVGGGSQGVLATAIQPDGKILIGGDFTTVAAVSRPRLARLNSDGSLDESFNVDVNFTVTAIYVQEDGKILIGGSFWMVNGTPQPGIARLNPDGTLDGSFGSNASFSSVKAIVVQSDGKIIIGGGFFGNLGTVQNPIQRDYIARLESTGAIDLSYNPGSANGPVESMALQADGKLLVAGYFSFLGAPRSGLARLDSTGTVDPDFHPDVTGGVHCVAVQKDQSIVIGGNISSVNGSQRKRFARLDPDGTLDSLALDISGSAVNCLAVRADGGLVIAGTFFKIGAEDHLGIAWLGPDGAVQSPALNPFGGGGGGITRLSVQADGKVVVAASIIARLHGGAASHLMDITSGNRIEWLRGGSAPETDRVLFEASADGGAPYVLLGVGSRIDGGWELTGANPPAGSFIRALARTGGADGCGSLPAVVMLPQPSDFSIASADPGEEWTFTVTHAATVPGLFLRVQSTVTPGEEGSWTDLPSGGMMSRTGDSWSLATSEIPAGLRYFRVIAAAQGYVDSKVVFNGSFNQVSPTGPILFTRGEIFERELVLMQADGSSQTVIAGSSYNIQASALSPDARFAAFTTLAGELFVMKAEPENGTTNVPVNVLAGAPQEAAFSSTFSWAPNGMHIAFFGSGSNVFVIKAVNEAGAITPFHAVNNGTIDVADSLAASPNPAWSADGRYLALLGANYIEAFQIMNANGVITPVSISNPTFPLTLTTEFATAKVFASWSPDGKQIAFVERNVSGTESKVSVLTIRDEDGELLPESGENPRVPLFPLTGDPQAETVSWSPDGSLLAIGARNGGQYFVEVFEPTPIGAENPRIAITDPSVTNGFQPSFAQAVAPAPPVTAPEISVELPPLTPLVDGSAFVPFGSQDVFTSGSAVTFTIRNSGNANLTVTLSRDGPHFGDFAVIAPANPTITPGATATFDVVFTPNGTGARNAFVRVISNDADENPFDIEVAGIGLAVAPEIVVEQPVGTNLLDGTAVVNFGSVNVGAVSVREFKISNSGNAGLTGLGITFAGANAADFKVVSSPLAPVSGGGGSTSFTIQFKPTAAGTRAATMHIASNDEDESVFDIGLAGEATAPPAGPEIDVEQPEFTSLTDNASTVDFGSVAHGATSTRSFVIRNSGAANLTGVAASLSGAGSASYLLTTKPAATVTKGNTSLLVVTFKPPATPGVREALLKIKSNDGDENPFEVNLTGVALAPTAPEFTASPTSQMLARGMTAAFLSNATGDPPPTFQWRKGTAAVAGAKSNNYSISNVQLTHAGRYEVKATNTGGIATSDGAELGVVEVVPKSFGAIAGGNISFTCNAAGNGITYEWRRNDVALVASSHLVGVDKKTLNIKGLLASDSGVYTCQVTGAAGSRASGPHTLNVVDQEPDITPLVDGADLPAGIVSRPYNYQVVFDPADSRRPSGWTASGLPPGMKIDGTGMISGTPKAAKMGAGGVVNSYSVKITASNGKGKDVVTVKLLIDPLPAGAVGKFEGPIARSPSLNSNLGGRFDLETKSTGSFTGKIAMGTSTYSFTGVLATDAEGLFPLGTANVVVNKVTLFTVTFTIDTANHRIDIGNISKAADEVAFTAWRKIWTKTVTPAGLTGNYTFVLDLEEAAPEAPQGNGFGTLSVNAATGALALKIKTFDDETIVATPVLGPQGQILVHHLLYGTPKGSLSGRLDIGKGVDPGFDTDNTLTGTISVLRPANTPAKTRKYNGGFGPLKLTLAGGRFNQPPLVLGVTAGPNNARLVFSEAGVGTPAPGPDILVGIGTANAITYPATNPRKTSLKLVPKTGEFSGSFTLDDPPAAKRVVTYQGVIILDGAQQRGYGYFMLPQLPSPTTSQILSGQVIFERP